MDGETKIDEVGDGIYRISTYLFDLLVFNQYLVVADEPLLEPGFEPVAVGRY